MLGFEPHCSVRDCTSRDSTDAEYEHFRLFKIRLSIPLCKRHMKWFRRALYTLGTKYAGVQEVEVDTGNCWGAYRGGG